MNLLCLYGVSTLLSFFLFFFFFLFHQAFFSCNSRGMCAEKQIVSATLPPYAFIFGNLHKQQNIKTGFIPPSKIENICRSFKRKPWELSLKAPALNPINWKQCILFVFITCIYYADCLVYSIQFLWGLRSPAHGQCSGFLLQFLMCGADTQNSNCIKNQRAGKRWTMVEAESILSALPQTRWHMPVPVAFILHGNKKIYSEIH